MTPKEIHYATGVSLGTIYKHLRQGYLIGDWSGTRWDVKPINVMGWSRYLWKEGLCIMYPPSFTYKYIEDFNLDR